jgi:hypothetical protein
MVDAFRDIHELALTSRLLPGATMPTAPHLALLSDPVDGVVIFQVVADRTWP